MILQHRWSAKRDESDPVEGATMKVCEDCGAELIATREPANAGNDTGATRIATLVYVAPCEGKPRARRA
jgi:hypothetical protein